MPTSQSSYHTQQSRRVGCRWLRLTAVALLWTAVGFAQDKPPLDATAPQTTLRAKGLYPVNGGYWVLQPELAVRRAAAQLEGLDRRHQQAVAKATEALAANETIRRNLAHAEALEAAKQPANSTSSTKVDSKSDPFLFPATTPTKLTSGLPDVTGLGEQTPLQLAMIELVNARTALQLAIVALLEDAPRLAALYEPLAKDETIAQALQQLGSKAKLGPTRDYDREVQRARALAATCFRREVPGYLESRRFRVPALLNRRHPATFTYGPQTGPIVLTASVAQRLGITPDAMTGEEREMDLFGRQVKARAVQLDALQLGSTVITSVPAVVLPPEAEDLGSFLPAEGLPGYRLRFVPRQMLLGIRGDK